MMDMSLGDSDWDSFSESGSSEDEDENKVYYDGQANCILVSLEETLGKIDEFLSFEREFMLGDVVCSATDQYGQMGRIVGLDMQVDLDNGCGKVIRNVSSSDLLNVRSISEGDFVLGGPWLGRVDKVIDSLAVVFDDGEKCEITTMDQGNVEPVFPTMPEDSDYTYFPGQRVRVNQSAASKSARWLCCSWKDNAEEGTICAVEVGLVYVDWLCSSPLGCDVHVPSPQRLQNAKDLTLLIGHPHVNWQLGDWCLLPIYENQIGMDQNEFTRELKQVERFTERNSGHEEAFFIVKTETKVDVLWQDGSRSLGVDSRNLISIGVAGAHEFWPEQFVLEEGACDDPDPSINQRWGIVQSVDAKERTVKVQWKTVALSEVNNVKGHLVEEILSAYELTEHPDYMFSFGDIVFRSAAQSKNCHQPDRGHPKSEILKGTNCISNKKNEADHYLSSVGRVIGFGDGAVEVRWASGCTSKVAPYEICRVDRSEVSNATPIVFEENVDKLTHDVAEQEKLPFCQNRKDLITYDGGDNMRKDYSWKSCSSFLHQAAIGFLSNITRSLFWSVGSTSLSVGLSPSDMAEDANEPVILHEREGLESDDLTTKTYDITQENRFNETVVYEKIKEIEGDEDLRSSRGIGGFCPFKQFDVLPDCSDHHFVGSGNGMAPSQTTRGWLKNVHQEWSTLEKNLPETIYVRVFEEGIDLLRAVIVGAPGTPYHDGLFFFDILIPQGYPHEPPLVHYISGGLRLNPNLHESGKVCLSLLNTWVGTGTEVWIPGSSTILQVLLSLQALVLNEKPYFNEAGYEKQMGRAEGERSSVSYNENAFLLTCKSMLYLLRKPPEHFGTLVEEHFRRRARHILLACQAYMDGASVGCAEECEERMVENEERSSRGFKIMLAKLLPNLVEAFSGIGIDCGETGRVI